MGGMNWAGNKVAKVDVPIIVQTRKLNTLDLSLTPKCSMSGLRENGRIKSTYKN